MKKIAGALMGLGLLLAGSSANALVITSQVGVNNGPIGALQPNLQYSGNWAWAHTYSVVGNILSATLDIDIIDADSGWLALTGDGMTIGDAGGNDNGAPGPWQVIGHPNAVNTQFNLGAGFFPLLADGSFNVIGTNVRMTLWGSNRAVLTITTDAQTQVPEPAAIAMFGLGLAGLGYMARRKKKQAA